MVKGLRARLRQQEVKVSLNWQEWCKWCGRDSESQVQPLRMTWVDWVEPCQAAGVWQMISQLRYNFNNCCISGTGTSSSVRNGTGGGLNVTVNVYRPAGSPCPLSRTVLVSCSTTTRAHHQIKERKHRWYRLPSALKSTQPEPFCFWPVRVWTHTHTHISKHIVLPRHKTKTHHGSEQTTWRWTSLMKS